jgi:threonine dehydrogenase-like Zn-dependent dehydrogenase
MWCGRCAWCEAGRTNLCAGYYTIGLNADGGLTERLDVPAVMCRAVPAACTDEAAAMAQPLAVALHAVDRASVTRDETVVLIGAGGIGLFLLAGLVGRGARVVALELDEEKLRGALRLGAVAALDPRDPGLGEAIDAALGGAPVDVVMEASGAPVAPALAQRLVRRGGRLVLVGIQAAPRDLDLADLVLREVDLLTSVAHVCDHDLPAALGLLASGSLAAEALDRVIALEAVVADGLEPLAAARVAGKVLVAPGGVRSGRTRTQPPRPSRAAGSSNMGWRGSLRRRPTTNQMARAGTSLTFSSTCGSSELKEIESPGPSV